ncbi:MAG: T9SS type A sorting domain-containing protein [Candidatus Limimorpha sp.]
MKSFLILSFIVLGLSFNLNAQWISPGNGTSFTMQDLVAVSNGAVSSIGDGSFSIVQDITISENDILSLTDDVTSIEVDEVTVLVKGSLFSNISDGNMLTITALNDDFTLRFENATLEMYNTAISKCGGIKLIETEAAISNCEFSYFTTKDCNGAFDYFKCDPSFLNCYFHDNQGAAIISGANIQGSPKIMDCVFERNVLSNINVPQINLGPGGQDSIYIVGNSVIGGISNMSGGISISDLLGTGATKALVKDNIVKDNRYGYNQQGQTISSLVIGNSFVDNNLETNPMNGGSGISVYGSSTECKALIRDNLITGNLWGVTAIYYHGVDLGTQDDFGNNFIFGNGFDGVMYELYNNAFSDIEAVGNWWGTAEADEVEDRIYHKNDDSSLGLVNYTPFLTDDGYNELVSNDFNVFPNPVSDVLRVEGDMAGNVSLFDISGRRIINCDNAQVIDVSGLARGVYLVRIVGDKGVSMVKVVKD